MLPNKIHRISTVKVRRLRGRKAITSSSRHTRVQTRLVVLLSREHRPASFALCVLCRGEGRPRGVCVLVVANRVAERDGFIIIKNTIILQRSVRIPDSADTTTVDDKSIVQVHNCRTQTLRRVVVSIIDRRMIFYEFHDSVVDEGNSLFLKTPTTRT